MIPVLCFHQTIYEQGTTEQIYVHIHNDLGDGAAE